MNIETFAEWLRLQGYKVIRTRSSYWYEISPRIYQAFPYHWQIEPTEEELLELLQGYKAIGLRFSAPLLSSSGALSYHVVYKTPPYNLENLSKKARYDVRKGLRHYHVEEIPFRRLAAEGWQLRLETLERQGRQGAETEEWWRDLCLEAGRLPGFEAWGAIDENGGLGAGIFAFICDEWCSILYQQSKTHALAFGANNALTYTFTNAILRRTGVTKVFYGLHSLDAPSTVDSYKFRMEFIAEPVRQRVVFHPKLATFFNQHSYSALKLFHQQNTTSKLLAKAEGMIRFYLEGQKPLARQQWPEALASTTLTELRSG